MLADDVRDFFESVDAEPSAQFSETLLGQLRAEYLRAGPDASRDAGRATLDDEGTVIVDVLHDEPRLRPGRGPARPSRHRRPIIVTAAAVAVVLIVGAFVFTTRDDQVPQPQIAARPPTTVEQLATAFLEAYWAFDADRALSYLTDDALAEQWRTKKEFRRSLSFFQAVGAKALNIDCAQQGKSASGIRVRCAYDVHMLGSDEIALGPYRGNYWDLTIRDGKIVGVDTRTTDDALTSGFSDEMWEPFARWVAAQHPQDVLKMYEDATQTGWRISDKSIPLWKQHTRDYVSSGAAYAGRGLLGLPPEGAPPSTPQSGELVAKMWSHPSEEGAFYVFADGRLIWSRDGYSPSGWLEQRLTPEGVELVRAEILSTGLFDPDQPPPGSELGLDLPAFGGYGDIEVRNHDRLVYVPRRPDQEWTNEFDRLHERLRELQSWLPPSAWQDRKIRPYVPSTYAMCLSTSMGSVADEPPIDPSRILPLLPAPAEEVLGDARHWRWGELGTLGRPALGPSPGTGPHCFDVTTEEARALTKALDDAGIERVPTLPTYRLSRRFDAPAPVSRSVDIMFWPYLPHGRPSIIGG